MQRAIVTHGLVKYARAEEMRAVLAVRRHQSVWRLEFLLLWWAFCLASLTLFIEGGSNARRRR
jgi:hypothetical protein